MMNSVQVSTGQGYNNPAPIEYAIGGALTGLQYEVNALSDTVAAILGRVEFVCSPNNVGQMPDSKRGEPQCAAPANSHIHERIAQQTSRVTAIRKQLEDAHSRLEV